MAPVYLDELVLVKNAKRRTRSCEATRLNYPSAIPRTKCGQRAFINVAPTLWNDLPAHVRDCTSLVDFKKQLNQFFLKMDINCNFNFMKSA